MKAGALERSSQSAATIDELTAAFKQNAADDSSYSKDKLALDQSRLALEQNRLALEQNRMTLDQNRLALDTEKNRREALQTVMNDLSLPEEVRAQARTSFLRSLGIDI